MSKIDSKNTFPTITLSIVSHKQASLIKSLLDDLSALPLYNFQILITINIPEDESPYLHTNLPLRIIRNESPKGFGWNHNQAFNLSNSPYFCVVNPDVRIQSLILEDLLAPFIDRSVGAASPLIFSPDGNLEDSARVFPTFYGFLKRLLISDRSLDYQVSLDPYTVDWIAGIFVVFRREAYEQVKGFDSHRFHMYLEDADICKRLAIKGWKVQVNPLIYVIHSAQKASHHDINHMRWHVISAFRFLTGF